MFVFKIEREKVRANLLACFLAESGFPANYLVHLVSRLQDEERRTSWNPFSI